MSDEHTINPQLVTEARNAISGIRSGIAVSPEEVSPPSATPRALPSQGIPQPNFIQEYSIQEKPAPRQKLELYSERLDGPSGGFKVQDMRDGETPAAPTKFGDIANDKSQQR